MIVTGRTTHELSRGTPAFTDACATKWLRCEEINLTRAGQLPVSL
jgi:hypothetical protein